MTLNPARADKSPAWPAAAMPGSAHGGSPPASLGDTVALWWRATHEALAAILPDGGSNDMRQNALVVFVIRVISAGLLFASQILLARWLGAASYGVYVSLWTAVLVIGGLSHLGLNMTMLRLVPQHIASGHLEELRGLLKGGRLFAIASSSLVALAAAAAVWIAGPLVRPDLVEPILLMLACLPLYALTDVQDGIGRGQSWALAGLVPPYILRPMIVLAFAVGAHAFEILGTASLAMIAALAATAIAAAVQTLMIQSCVRNTVAPGPETFAFKKWLGISLPLLAVGGCEILLQNTDVLMLNLFRPSHEIGVYYAAAKTTTLALFVHYAIGSAYAGRIAAAGATDDRDTLIHLVREAVHWTFWPSLLIVAAVAAAGRPLLELFGPEFVSAYPMIMVLSVGILARAAMGPSEMVLNMLGEQRACARSFAAAAAVCVALNLILIPLFGTIGAAVATAAGFSTAATLNWRFARRLLKLDVFIFSRSFWRGHR